ncbi:MAG: HesB-like protein [Bacillota bacterium]|nr:HesB-like protein [Bacillota bacterium]
MCYIQISDEAYNEFKEMLDSSPLGTCDIRISYMGRNCNGTLFNIDAGIEEENDVVEQVKDIKFIMEKTMLDEYEGFIILSNNENNGTGLELKPVVAPPSPCTVCPGC